MPTGLSIINEIEAHLDHINSLPNEREQGMIHCSEVYYCPRKMYYGMLKVEVHEQVGHRLRLVFDTGHAVHGQLQGYLTSRLNHRFITEHKVYSKEPPLVGSVDGIWMPEEGGADVGVEFKTIADASFSRLIRPITAHVWQVHCYMHCTDIKGFLILYYGKNSSEMKEFWVRWDDEVWDEVTKKINLVLEAVKKEEPPRATKTMQCKDCGFAYTCDVGGGSSWRPRKES